MNQLFVFAVTILIFLVLYFVYRKAPQKIDILLKTIALTFFIWAFMRLFLNDGFIWVINYGYYSGTLYNKTDVFQSLLRWGQYISYIVLTMAVFFDNRFFRNVAVYFCLPIAILCTLQYSSFINYFLDPTGRGYKISFCVTHAFFSIELIMMLLIPLILRFILKHKFDYKNKREWKTFAIWLPIVVLQLVPVYLPQSLMGYTEYRIGSFNIVSIIWILYTLALGFAIYLIFRFRPYKIRYMVCVYLSLFLFMHYNSIYLMGFPLSRIPIQLCNLGAYLYLIAIVFKSKHLFNFSFIANVVGTIIAMSLPDMDHNLTSFWSVHFMIEHSYVLIIPCVMAALKIFPRIKLNALKHVAVGFIIYFLVCSISGTILNGYSDSTGSTVNFFYIFDLDMILSIFPFLSWTSAIHLTWGRFELYPVFQLAIFLGFLMFCVLFYFVILQFYKLADDRDELRAVALNLRQIKVQTKKTKNSHKEITT